MRSSRSTGRSTDVRPGDHVVVNPIAPGAEMIGSGGPQGALSEFLLVKEAVVGRSLAIIPAEVDIVTAMGYPTEIFQVTREIAENWEKFALIVSDRFAFSDVQKALETASTPGAADKVVVTF